MADLKRRLAPLADVDMPERWSDIQRRAPRAGFDPEPPRRHPAAAIAVAVLISLLTVGWLASGFRSNDDQIADEPRPTVVEPTPNEVDQAPTAGPEPEPTLDPQAVDLGLGFGICDAESVGGGFGTGTSTRVWFGTRTAEGSLKCQRSSRQHVLAVDIGGDRQAEAWIDPIGPNVCWLDCGIAGLADLDADRTDEVVLLLEGGAIQTYGVVDIAADGQPTLLGYAGEPPQGIPANGPAKFTIGGDEAYSYAVSCTGMYPGPVIEQRASAGVVDALELGATVQTYTVLLTPDGFEVLSDEVTEGVVPPPVLPARGDLCGLELPEF
jgi:hypothetical protein